MNRHAFLTVWLTAVALFTMGQSSSCKAPMDATGSYSGTWTFYVKDNGTVIDELDCPLSMTLEQDVAQDPPENLSVNGTIHVDFSCLDEAPNWPPGAAVPEPSDVAVGGTMDANGKIVLLSGGCGPGTCIILALDGQGEAGVRDNSTARSIGCQSLTPAADDIPSMQHYSGEWGIAIGVAFLGSVADNGTFAVFRDE